MLKRAAGPGVVGLLGLGLELSGLQVKWLGYGLMGLAALWALAAVGFPVLVRHVAMEVRDELGLPALAVETPRETGELRVAVGQLSDELEYAQSVIANREHTFFEEGTRLPMRWYDNHGTILARSGKMEAHKAMREAYRRIDELNRNVVSVSVGGAMQPRIPDARAEAALPAIRAALDQLQEIRLTGD